MKKSLFIAVMMLFGVFGFSNSSMACDENLVANKMQAISKKALHYVKPFADCTITVKGDSGNGSVSYTITVHGLSCAELIRKVLQR